MNSRFQISYDLDPPPRHVVDAGLHLAARYETLATLGGYGQSIRAVDLPDGWMAYIVNLPHAKTIHFVGEGGEAVARPQEEEYVKPGTTVVPILYHYTGISTNQELVAAASEIAELAGYSSDFASLTTLKLSTTYFLDNNRWAVTNYELSNDKPYSDVACFKLGIPVDAAIRKVSSDSNKFQGYRCDPKRYTGILPMVIQLLLGVGRVLPSEVDDDKTDIEYAKDSRAASLTDDDLQSYGSMTLDDAVDSGLSMRLKYDYRWGRTHGIVWARRAPKTNAPFIQSSDPERIWEPFLCEIGTRGVLLMPLPRDGASFDAAVRDAYLSLNPTLRSVVTDTHAEAPFFLKSVQGNTTTELYDIAYNYDMLAQDRLGAKGDGNPDLFWILGGFPTDECFPQDDIELDRLINSGVVIRLSNSILDWFYSNKAVSLDHGWAFTKFTNLMNPFFPAEQSVAANVCYEEDSFGHATYSHAVTIEFSIAQVDREYTSLVEDVISTLSLTRFVDIYKATLLTDEQAIAILASGSYEYFLAVSCEPEWAAYISVDVVDFGNVSTFISPYLPNSGVTNGLWQKYYAHDFLPDYTYFNEPLVEQDAGGNVSYVARMYDSVIYKTWDSVSNSYVLFNPYNPNSWTEAFPPLTEIPGFEFAPYKAFFVYDSLCIFGRYNYFESYYYNSGYTPMPLVMAYTGFYTNNYGKFINVGAGLVDYGAFVVLANTSNYNILPKLSISFSFFGQHSWVPDNNISTTAVENIVAAYTAYQGSLSPPYVIPQNTLYCAGGELKKNVNIAIDIRDSRAGIATLCFEDIHFGYSFELTDNGCQMVNPGHHYQIVDGYVRALETYSDLHLFFAAYENNPSNFVFAGGDYPYAGRFFVTDSIWPVFLDYLNPLRSPPPVEYFRLHCGGSEEMYIKSNISIESLPTTITAYAPKIFYFEPLVYDKAFELRNYILSEQIPLDSIPFGCFPWHLIGD